MTSKFRSQQEPDRHGHGPEHDHAHSSGISTRGPLTEQEKQTIEQVMPKDPLRAFRGSTSKPSDASVSSARSQARSA